MREIIKGFLISLGAHAMIIAGVAMPLLKVHRSIDVAPILENSGLTFTIAELPEYKPVKIEMSEPSKVVKSVPKPQVPTSVVTAPPPIATKTTIPLPVVTETPVVEELPVEELVEEMPVVNPIIIKEKIIEEPLPTPIIAERIVEATPKAEKSSARIEKPAMPAEPISVSYPRRARRAGIEGDVTLSVSVGIDGTVKAVSILSGTGLDELDRAAEKAIWRARFTPASIDGAPVEASVVQVISFRLKD